MKTEITIPIELAETLRGTLESKVVLKEATEKQEDALKKLEEIMGFNSDIIVTISIEVDRYVLTDFLKEDGTPYGEAWLTIYKDVQHETKIDFWDNTGYITSLLKDIKEEKESGKVAETKEFCEENGIDYNEFSISLQQLYKKALTLKMIKND